MTPSTHSSTHSPPRPINRALKPLWIALVVTIGLLSMRSFAAIRTPEFNSDNAIHVLMAYHLTLPDDLYYWGQDRLGSLLPILSHLLLKLIPLPVATAVSIVQYALLAFGYVCFASLLRHPVSRIVFALVWFLPLRPLTELVSIGHPYGPQLASIGAACVAFDRRRQSIAPVRRRLWLAVAIGCLMISLWVSDFTIVVLVLLGLWGLWQTVQIWRHDRKLPLWDTAIVLSMVGGGLLLIRFAKAQSRSRNQYGSFATIEQSIDMVRQLLTSLWNTLTFQAASDYLSIHALLAVALLIFLGWALITHRSAVARSMSGWFYLFLGTAIVGTSLLLISSWVYRNELNHRYFIITYVMLWLAVLLLSEALPSALTQPAIALMLLTAIASSLSLPSSVYSIEQPRSKIAQLQPLTTLGNAGFIGNYWYSYVLCAVDPAMLNCSRFDPEGEVPCPPPNQPPRQQGRVRCMRCIPQVFASDTIYLVKDKWFDKPPFDGDFPSETQQFRQCLVKAGEARDIAGYTIAPYRLKTAGERVHFGNAARSSS